MLVQCEKGLGDLFVQLLGYAASLSENQFRIFQLPLLIELVIFGGQVRKPSVFKLLEEPQFLSFPLPFLRGLDALDRKSVV